MKAIIRMLSIALLAGAVMMAGTTTGHAKKKKVEMMVTCTASLGEVQFYMSTNHSINIVSYDEVNNLAKDGSGNKYAMVFDSHCSIVSFEDIP